MPWRRQVGHLPEGRHLLASHIQYNYANALYAVIPCLTKNNNETFKKGNDDETVTQ